MKKGIEIFVKTLVYASFFVPLVVAPTSFIFPFIVPKILLFRSILTLMAAGYILLLITNWSQYRPRFTILNLVLVGFLFSFTLSTFFGADWYHSFWDNHERMLGLFTIFHYIVYYFICSSVFKNWKEWRGALRVFLVAGSLVMLVGLLQVGNPQLLLNQGSDRISSTLGNPIYVGGYGLFLAFLAFLLIMREKRGSFWLYVEIVLGIMAVLGMFFSGTRGSVFGMIAGIGVGLICYLIVLKDYPKLRKTIGALMILGVVLLGVLYANRQSEFVKGIPAIGRTLNTSLSGFTNGARWIAWSLAVESWKERPVFGWGPNNYFYAFNKYYNPKSLELGYGETWFDNAHNIFVNTLNVQGLVGIVVYICIFILAIFSVWKTYKQGKLNRHVVVVATAFLVAHLVQNITVFENPTSYLYFMFWLAMINRLSIGDGKSVEQGDDKDAQSSIGDKGLGFLSVGVAGVVALLVVFIFNIQPARANSKTLQALRTLGTNPILAYQDIRDALEFSSPHVDDIRADISRQVAQTFNTIYNSVGKDKSAEILNLTYDGLQKNLTLHPLDIRNQLTLAQLARIKAVLENDSKYISESEKYLEDALSKSQKRQQIIYTLADLKMQLRKYDEAIKMLEQALQDDDKIVENYWRLAYVYKQAGKQAKAEEVIALAAKNQVVFGDDVQGIIGQILASSTAKTTNTKK